MCTKAGGISHGKHQYPRTGHLAVCGDAGGCHRRFHPGRPRIGLTKKLINPTPCTCTHTWTPPHYGCARECTHSSPSSALLPEPHNIIRPPLHCSVLYPVLFSQSCLGLVPRTCTAAETVRRAATYLYPACCGSHARPTDTTAIAGV